MSTYSMFMKTRLKVVQPTLIIVFNKILNSIVETASGVTIVNNFADNYEQCRHQNILLHTQSYLPTMRGKIHMTLEIKKKPTYIFPSQSQNIESVGSVI